METPNAPKLELPGKLRTFFTPGKRHYVLYGGRGSGKSWSVAAFLVVKALFEKHRILCAREYQTSIRESVKALLEGQIDRLGYRAYFTIKERSITSISGSEFIFSGLRHNIDSIKSTEGLTIVWIEEAHVISRQSMDTLNPTVRAPGSFFLYTLNPRFPYDPIFEDFIDAKVPRDDVRAVKLNYSDSKWFANSPMVDEMLHMKRTNPGMYRHIWEGDFLQDDEARIFTNVTVEDFETPDDAVFMHGADFGFSQDPSVILRSFMSPDEKTIFVDHEYRAHHLSLDDHPSMYERVPNIKSGLIVGDSARPETIDHLNKLGFFMTGAKKGKDSVRDGISFLQSKNIVIHPRCQGIIAESYAYVFKRHPQTNLILPEPEDANNHGWDALRYAWEGAWMEGGFHIVSC